MIRSDAEYRKATDDLERLVSLIVDEEAHWAAQGLDADQVEAMIRPTRLRLGELGDRIDTYERVRSGDLSMFSDLEDVGRALIATRLAKGLSQREFAEMIGVHESQVSRDERNEYHGVGRERLLELLETLGLRFEGHFELAEVVVRPRFVVVDQPLVYQQAAGLALDAEEVRRELINAVA